MPTLYYFFISMEIKVLNDCCAEGYVSRTVSFADGFFYVGCITDGDCTSFP